MEYVKEAENLVRENLNTLRFACNDISEYLAENESDNEALKSGRFSNEGIREIKEGINARNEKIADIKRNTEASISAKLDTFLNEHTPQLDPAEITDDTKLLSCGVNLNAQEVASLLRKNLGNYTMTTLLLRYAEEKELSLDMGVIGSARQNLGVESMKEFVNAERSRVSHAIKYLDNSNGLDVIGRFYEV